MTRGRPVSTGKAWEFHVHLRLRVGEDDDLIEFLGGLPPRKRAVALKTALRTGAMNISHADELVSDDELFFAADDFLK